MDKILRTLICGGQVSLAVLQTTDLVNEAIKIHGTSGEATRLLGGLLTCGAYLSSALKEEGGSVSLTVKAKDGDGAVSVSADAALHVRGYADGSCSQTLVGGTLTVVREDGFSRPFCGTCEILSDNISDILETYFGQSEQIPTAAYVQTLTDKGGKCVWAGGVVMQLLPDASEESIATAGDAFNAYAATADGLKQAGGLKQADGLKEADSMKNADGIFGKFFAHLSEADCEAQLFPQYRCNCSEQKIRGVLATVGKAELLNICRELGEVKVHCHYCNKDYIYDEESIEESFK